MGSKSTEHILHVKGFIGLNLFYFLFNVYGLFVQLTTVFDGMLFQKILEYNLF